MKKKSILLASVLICISIILVSVIYKPNKDENKKTISNSGISIMIKNDNGTYTESETWPKEGYVVNTTKSKCNNGTALTYNEATGSVSLSTGVSDKCIVYFDKTKDLKITPYYNGTLGVPSTVGASVSTTCTGANVTYNSKYNRLEVSGISSEKAECNITYTNRTSKTYLNNKIIGLAGTTQGTGQVVNENGYRYEGKNPNNYVWFNNELWRIIGVFGSESHGVSNTNLVKIIRDEPLGALAWDMSKTNDWSASSLKKLWNPIDGDSASGSYYNKTNGTGNEYCYGSSTVGANCDYSEKGINATYRPMIKNVTWYLGGMSNVTGPANVYAAERGTTGGGANPTLISDTGYIGLMYVSDYGYSILSSSCARTTNLSSYNKAECAGQSWLYGNGKEWTIMPLSNVSMGVLYVDSSGHVSNRNANFGYVGRPVLYLDASVYLIDGNGSVSNPYIIGM